MNDTHGGNVHALKRARGAGASPVLDLSTNTFAGCADLAADIIAATPADCAHYPDPEYYTLREAIAAHERVPPAAVLPGNGAAELIWLCLAALRPRQVLLIGPMFSEYARACAQLGIVWSVLTPPPTQGFAPGSQELAAIRCSPADMVVLCLPNNPAGVTYANLSELGAACGRRIVLADLSYREFLHGTPDAEPTAWRHLARQCAGPLIGLHSLTKFFCCPGIRLGYALAPEAILARLRAHQPPWMVGENAACIGVRMLEQATAFQERLPELRVQRDAMMAHLHTTEMFAPDGVFAGPSFVTARLAAAEAVSGGASGGTPATSGTSLGTALGAALGTADSVRAELAKHGVLIRSCDTIPGMPTGYIRMQVRDAGTLAPLYAALRMMGHGTVAT